MFVGGIGSHLKVSQVDKSVCLGNELNNLSTRKDFLLKNIKSSHPNNDDVFRWSPLNRYLVLSFSWRWSMQFSFLLSPVYVVVIILVMFNINTGLDGVIRIEPF